MRPSVKNLLLFGSTAPYSGALLALDFVGSRTNGQPYYMLNGATYPRVNNIPGWTYTGGTPAGTGSYAARADGSLQFFPSYTNTRIWTRAIENAAWVKRGTGSATASAIASSDGTIAGSLLAGIGTAGVNDVYQLTQLTLPPSSSYAPSLWINRVSTSGVIALKNAEDATKGEWRIDLTTLGAGWQYITRSHSAVTVVSEFSTTAAGLNGLHFTAFSGSPLSFYVDKIQTELGSTASPYIPTTTAAVTVGTPRITDAGYWAEEARTNLLTYSQQFDNAAWTKSATTVTANQATAPDGTLTADALAETATTAQHVISNFTSKAASPVTYTASWYVKQFGTARNAKLSITDAAGAGADYIVNPVTGAVLSGPTYYGGVPFSAASVVVTQVANGFAKIDMTATSNSTAVIQSLLQPASGTTLSYLGSTDTGFYIWQADLQAGSFATSPIPTTSVAVTRAADIGAITGLSINSSPVTILANVKIAPVTNTDTRFLTLSDGSNNNRIALAKGAAGTIGNFVVSGGSTQTGVDVSAISSPAANSAFNDAASIYGTTGWNAAANGVVGGATGAITPPVGPLNNLAIGSGYTGSAYANAAIRRIVIYPRAFGNSELQAITTAGAY